MRVVGLLAVGLCAGCGLFGPDHNEVIRGFTAVTYAQGRYVAVGGAFRRMDDFVAFGSDTTLIFVSDDGRNWRDVSLRLPGSLSAVTFGEDRFVAVGTVRPSEGMGPQVSDAVVLTSFDGETWPFAVYLLRNFFGSLPRDLFEAAHMDGASDLQVFFRIALPLALPAIASLAIFQFLWVWNDLLIALIFLGDPDLAPITLKVSNLVSSFGQDYELLTAAAFISMIVPLMIFFALQRFFVQGLLAGSVKG